VKARRHAVPAWILALCPCVLPRFIIIPFMNGIMA
jgi:hypothetical protein